MNLAKILRYFIAGLILLYVWRVVVPSMRHADGWNIFGLLLFLVFALGLALRKRSGDFAARPNRTSPSLDEQALVPEAGDARIAPNDEPPSGSPA